MARPVLAAVLAVTLAAPVAAQRATVAMDPSPVGNPGGWITPDDYPKDAVRAGRQGRTVAALDIDAAGQVKACRIDLSSGTESLDSKTCEIALERGRFNPATDRRGRSVAGRYNLPVRWVLPESTDDPFTVSLDVGDARADVEAEIAVGVDGKVTSCRMITQVAPSARGADQCLSLKPGTVWGTLFTKDGQPTAVIIRQRFTRSIESATTTP